MQDEGEDDFLLIFLEYDNNFVPLRKICVFLTKIIWNLDYNEEDSLFSGFGRGHDGGSDERLPVVQAGSLHPEQRFD